MSQKLVLEDYIEFDSQIERCCNNFVALKQAVNISVLIYDDDYSRISYKYPKNDEVYTINHKELKESISSEMFSNNQVKLNRCVYSEDEIWYHMDIYLPYTANKLLLGSFIFQYENEQDLISKLKTHDTGYVEQLCYHIQTVVASYEKLYYTIDMYSELLMAKDHFMPYHMTNVANWSLKLALELDIVGKDRLNLYIAALLHDVGKLMIPDSIINKPGKLTEEEFDVVKEHSPKGAKIIEATLYGMSIFQKVPDIILHHHEKWDGSGYPAGLMGAEIPLAARVLKVADSVDAMLSRRAYKNQMSYQSVINELSVCSGIHFDPRVANKMIEILDEYVKRGSEETISNTNFIGQASITFYYNRYDNIRAYKGNLIIRKNIAQFIVHDQDLDEDLDLNLIYRVTISFLSMNDFIEYKVNVQDIIGNRILVKDFIFLPTDKLFSLIWEGKTKITIDDNIKVEADIMKLGGSTIVLSSDIDHHDKIVGNMGKSYFIHLDESIEDLNLNLNVNVRLLKYYKSSNQYIYIFNYVELLPAQKDSILRLLFRKQVLNKRQQSKN
jgi:HD-GYP domain-containing protein (c-di-GMP phosphodiesterase class II)